MSNGDLVKLIKQFGYLYAQSNWSKTYGLLWQLTQKIAATYNNYYCCIKATAPISYGFTGLINPLGVLQEPLKSLQITCLWLVIYKLFYVLLVMVCPWQPVTCYKKNSTKCFLKTSSH